MIVTLLKTTQKPKKRDLSVPARTKLSVKLKFFAVRLLQKSLGKQDPEYTDYKYWKENGWLGAERPWKRIRSFNQ